MVEVLLLLTAHVCVAASPTLVRHNHITTICTETPRQRRRRSDPSQLLLSPSTNHILTAQRNCVANPLLDTVTLFALHFPLLSLPFLSLINDASHIPSTQTSEASLCHRAAVFTTPPKRAHTPWSRSCRHHHRRRAPRTSQSTPRMPTLFMAIG